MTSTNYYDILGVEPDATEKDIIRGYRKKALKCHPDKNPDNPKAAELFITLSDALEILTDATARAAFDKVLKAKEAARLRTQAFDSKRKKFKEDLEKREKAAEVGKENNALAAEQLAAQIKRLREEGSRLLHEQQELMRKQLAEEKKKTEEHSTPKLKVKWTASKKDHQNGGYNEAILMELFGKYGQIIAVVISRKNGMAIIEYANAGQATIALEFEKGLEENPVTVSWLDGNKKVSYSPPSDDPPKEDTDPKPPSTSDDDFESMVLKRMKQAQEKKRMTQEIIEDARKESDQPDLT